LIDLKNDLNNNKNRQRHHDEPNSLDVWDFEYEWRNSLLSLKRSKSCIEFINKKIETLV
jgi:hypothetical protein